MPLPMAHGPQFGLCVALLGLIPHALCSSDGIPSLQRKQLTDLYTVATWEQKKEPGPGITTTVGAGGERHVPGGWLSRPSDTRR